MQSELIFSGRTEYNWTYCISPHTLIYTDTYAQSSLTGGREGVISAASSNRSVPEERKLVQQLITEMDLPSDGRHKRWDGCWISSCHHRHTLTERHTHISVKGCVTFWGGFCWRLVWCLSSDLYISSFILCGIVLQEKNNWKLYFPNILCWHVGIEHLKLRKILTFSWLSIVTVGDIIISVILRLCSSSLNNWNLSWISKCSTFI